MFHFSLQSVLEVRERLEKLKQKEYSEALLARQALEDQIADYQEQIGRSGASMDAMRSGSPSAFGLQLHTDFRKRLASEIARLSKLVQEISELVELKRRELVEARRSHKSLEILRDKERARYALAESRRERAEFDEVASVYHVFHQG